MDGTVSAVVYDKLLDKNIRNGSLLAFWYLKARMIRLCSVAFRKWLRFADASRRAEANAPNDDTMTDEMEKLHKNAIGSRRRRKAMIPVKSDELENQEKKNTEFEQDAFADSMQEAILDGKRNLLCKYLLLYLLLLCSPVI